MNCNIETTPDMDKELYTPEEAYELTMKDIKAIYDKGCCPHCGTRNV